MTNIRFEAWMNGAALGSVSPDLYITEISARPASRTTGTSEIYGRNGELEGSTKWRGATVTISFILKKSTETARQKIVSDVAAWADRGVLEISDRPGQQLHVICTTPPYVPGMCSWTDPISLTLQTMENPFWKEKTPAVLALSGTSASGNLYVPGNVGDALVDVTVTPASGTMANCTLTVAGNTFTLNGVNATTSDPLKVSYDDYGFLSIKRGTTSVMDKRTGASADDLKAPCGKTSEISFTASASATAVFSARGLTL